MKSAVLMLATVGHLLAQDVAPADDSDSVPGVDPEIESLIITGQRPEGWSIKDYMLDFVGEIGDPTSDNHGYARWRDRICVSVINLRDAPTAQYVVDRVSTIAMEVGLRPGEPGCRPNLSIIFATDGAATANSLVTESPQAFRPFGGAGGTTQGRRALDQFVTSDAPVRWWQLTMPVDRLGQVAINLYQGDGAPTNSSPGSLITNSVSDELWATYVIVDMTKLAGANVRQLADYLAMVSLAQIDPTGIPANYNSILNLFKAPSPASGMTELDHTYLRALYAMDTRRMPGMQRSLLASTMMLEQEKMANKEAVTE